MNDIALSQLLTKVKALMTEEVKFEKPVTTATQPIENHNELHPITNHCNCIT